MKPADKLKELVGRIAPVLKGHGFSRKGLTFYINRDGNYGLINFQKSTKSNSDMIIFTINIGVISRRLLQFFSAEQRSTDLFVDNCHWRERIGFMLPTRQDKWWTIEANTSTEHLAEELCEYIVSLAIPEINKYIEDEALRDLWLSGRSPGLTNFQRLMNLSVMVKALGPSDELESVMRDLQQAVEGQPTASVAERHLRRLEQESAPAL